MSKNVPVLKPLALITADVVLALSSIEQPTAFLIVCSPITAAISLTKITIEYLKNALKNKQNKQTAAHLAPLFSTFN